MIMRTRFFAILSLLFFSLPAPAQPLPVKPYEGMWFPVGEPGSGFVVDQEDDTLVVTFFTYDAEGATAWYLASGQQVAGLFESTAYQYRDGSCLQCEHVVPEEFGGVPVRLEFTGKTIGWMTWDGAEPKPVYSLAFGSPHFQSFGPVGPHGPASMYDMSGRWLFTGDAEMPILFDAEFKLGAFLDPGGFLWESPIDSEFGIPYQYICIASSQDDINPQCDLKRRTSRVNEPTIFSVFWADLGPDRLLGYTSDKPEVGSEVLRGTGFVHGFRLTGPLVGTLDDPWDADPDAMDKRTALYLDKGMWMEPGKPGSGMTLDWQNDVVVATFFTYREDGEPVWYQGSGILNGDGAVEFEIEEFTQGSCFNCEHRFPETLPDPVLATLEPTSKTTAWLRLGDGEPIPLRALAFDSPGYREFGEATPFGRPGQYDLRGEWVFVSTSGIEDLFHRVTFDHPEQMRGGRTLSWKSEDGAWNFRCDADPEKLASPQCRLLQHDGERWLRHLSAHWADVGEDQIIGYREQPLSGADGVTRGQDLVFGFRLSGPHPAPGE